MNCIRFNELNARLPSVYTPCVCFIVQGSKRVLLDTETYEYRPSQFLAVSVDLPVIGEVTEGCVNKPYLCLQVELDQVQLAELLIQASTPPAQGATTRGIFVGKVDASLGDCALRLARLLDSPQDIPLLAPMIKRELYYRLLTGAHAVSIAQLARAGSAMQRVAQAIRELKSNFDKPVRIEDLAARIGMSVSSFHAHFKAVTAMSPLQYQKRLRLMEARQIMLMEQRDAASTAYRVGYESPSQFSREYARVFGNPPGRDIQQLAAARSGA
ncbi:MAG: AraC family transcriptional regulator [Pseudomonadota bacterium]|nr:AraC family transcriptional regulator [Pseudomonadota bacterium]